jgi:hypothetical protein
MSNGEHIWCLPTPFVGSFGTKNQAGTIKKVVTLFDYSILSFEQLNTSYLTNQQINLRGKIVKIKQDTKPKQITIKSKFGSKKLNIWPLRDGSENEIIKKITLKKIYAFIGIWVNGDVLSLVDNTQVIEIKLKE